MATLIIIPCAQSKIWEKYPNTGPTEAKDAYVSGPFQAAREYAEKHSSYWLILSAKYGLIRPDFVIEENYDVSFNNPASDPISAKYVQDQVKEMEPDRFDAVIGLGGEKYRQVLTAAFAPREIQFPFAGLPIGKMMQAIKKATAEVPAHKVALSSMDAFLTALKVGVSFPRPNNDLDEKPTHFIPSWKYQAFVNEIKAHPQVISLEDRSIDMCGMVYTTFKWDEELGMDVPDFITWAQNEVRQILVKYLVPIYKELWHD